MALADGFSQLLDSDPREQIVQAFLEVHPEILKRWTGASAIKQRFLTKVSFHSFVTDFVIGEWRSTINRWEWTLIEIERPRHRLFTKNGDPTSELSHALRQITDWRVWVQSNLHFARTILPDIIPLCKVGIIIGRRTTISDQDRDRLQMLQIQSPWVQISTFDALLDVCLRLDGEST